MNAKSNGGIVDLRCWNEWREWCKKYSRFGIERIRLHLCDYCHRGSCPNAKNSSVSYTWR